MGFAKVDPFWIEHYPENSLVYSIFEKGSGYIGNWGGADREARLEEEMKRAVEEGNLENQLALTLSRISVLEDLEDYREKLDLIREAEAIAYNLSDTIPLKIPFYSLTAIFYSKLEQHRYALAEFKRKFDLVDRWSPEPDVIGWHTLSRISSEFLKLGQADSALHYREVGLEYVLQLDNPVYHASGYNNLGMTQYELGQLDAAEQNFDRALEILQPLLDRPPYKASLVPSILDNIGMVHEARDDYAAALETYQLCWEKCLDHCPPRRQIKVHFRLATCYWNLGQQQAALEELAPCMVWMEQEALSRNVIHDDFESAMLELATKVYLEAGDAVKLGQATRLRQMWSQHLVEFYQDEALTALNTMMRENEKSFQQKMAQKEATIAREQTENQLQRFQLYLGLAGAFILILILGILLVRRTSRLREADNLDQFNQRLLEAEKENSRLREEQLEMELSRKKKDLTEMALSISVRREENEFILTRLKEFQQLSPDKLAGALKELVNELTYQNTSNESRDLLQENIEQVNAGFFDQLQSDFPQLTRTDKSLCALVRLQLTNKEIASIRNVSPNAVKMGKNRLRKKLGLQPGANLESFLAAY